MGYSISKAQLDLIKSGLLDKLGSPEDLTKIGITFIDGALQIITDQLRAVITEKGLVATKVLRSSVDPTKSTRIGTDVTGSIVMAPHWRDVNFGLKPHQKRPKVSDIEKWISAKGIPVWQSRSHSLKTVLQMRKMMATSIARAIWEKGTIKRFGYKGAHFIEDVVNPRNLRVISEKLAEIYGEKLTLYALVPK